MIPKIIHYCWFGGRDLPLELKSAMKTWEILKNNGYKIIKWDETNCLFNENEFVKKAYSEKRWGFLSDYYRLKAVYEYGGIYLDTDVIVKNTFDDLLENHAFCGMYTDYAVSTAVFGGEKKSTFVKRLLNMYDTGNFSTHNSVKIGEEKSNPYETEFKFPNNEFWTWNIIETYGLSCLAKTTIIDCNDVSILPKTFLETGSIKKKYYTRHLNTGLWKNSKKTNLKKKMIKLIKQNEYVWIITTNLKIIKSSIIHKKYFS